MQLNTTVIPASAVSTGRLVDEASKANVGKEKKTWELVGSAEEILLQKTNLKVQILTCHKVQVSLLAIFLRAAGRVG